MGSNFVKPVFDAILSKQSFETICAAIDKLKEETLKEKSNVADFKITNFTLDKATSDNYNKLINEQDNNDVQDKKSKQESPPPHQLAQGFNPLLALVKLSPHWDSASSIVVKFIDKYLDAIDFAATDPLEHKNAFQLLMSVNPSPGVKMTQYLLRKYPDKLATAEVLSNQDNKDGNTVLHMLAAAPNLEVEQFTKILIDCPDRVSIVNIKNRKSESPVHLAAAQGRSEHVGALIDAGAKPDFINGGPLLASACTSGDTKTVEMLLPFCPQEEKQIRLPILFKAFSVAVYEGDYMLNKLDEFDKRFRNLPDNKSVAMLSLLIVNIGTPELLDASVCSTFCLYLHRIVTTTRNTRLFTREEMNKIFGSAAVRNALTVAINRVAVGSYPPAREIIRKTGFAVKEILERVSDEHSAMFVENNELYEAIVSLSRLLAPAPDETQSYFDIVLKKFQDARQKSGE